MNKDLIRDNEGETLGNVESYVERFKNLGEENNNNFSPKTSIYSVSRSSKLPEKWDKNTEKEILIHYYQKFGDFTFNDFVDVSPKIAAYINRVYAQKLTPEDINKRIAKIPKDQFEENKPVVNKQRINFEKEEKSPFPKINITEKSYPYKRKLKRLSCEQLELCQFIDDNKLCFSSDNEGFFLTVKSGADQSFDKLFNFSSKEQMVYEMFKEQLGDENKAKKLVLMSRILNQKEEKQIPKKKRGRPSKKVSSLTHSSSGHI